MYTVEIKGLDKQIYLLDHYDQLADTELGTAMQASVTTIAEAAKIGAPYFRGRLTSSLLSQVTRDKTSTVGVVYSSITDSPYPLVMEYGRRPGAKPPPVAAIRPWVIAKFGDASLAYVIARSIGRKGIKPRRFLKKAYTQSKPAIDGYFRTALERLTNRLSVGSGE
jgi:hypothetical protein